MIDKTIQAIVLYVFSNCSLFDRLSIVFSSARQIRNNVSICLRWDRSICTNACNPCIFFVESVGTNCPRYGESMCVISSQLRLSFSVMRSSLAYVDPIVSLSLFVTSRLVAMHLSVSDTTKISIWKALDRSRLPVLWCWKQKSILKSRALLLYSNDRFFVTNCGGIHLRGINQWR